MNKLWKVAIPLLGIATAHAAVFEDGFDYPQGLPIGASWQNPEPSNPWKSGGGQMRVDVRRPPAMLLCTALETASGHGVSFSVSAEVEIPASNNWAGIVFNYQDPENFYCLRFKAGTRSHQLLARVDGKWRIVASANDAAETFEPGTPYALEVFSEYPYEFHFTIRKAGTPDALNPVADATDSYSHFTKGLAGLYSDSTRGVRFGRFRMETGANPPRRQPRFTDGGSAPEYKILERIPVEPVWAATPVGFALETVGDRQFIAYYDADRQMTVAQRTLGSKEWKFQKLDSFLEWDSHNYIEMAFDSQGHIHISGNMHVVPLVYFRPEKPFDVASLKKIDRMTGEREQRCTYPKFLKNQNGELIFNYRDGSSGNGTQLYNIYDAKNQTWRRLTDRPLADGEGRRNAYFTDPKLGPDGWFHMTWVWRESPDCSSNHDLSYARSRDLVHWETAAGDPIALPIRLDTPSVIVDPIPVRGGLLNGNGQVGFDSQNRVVLAYHKFDENGKTQLYNARLENGEWKIVQTSDWDYRWYFSGGGCIIGKIHIAPVELADGELRQAFSHAREGSGKLVLDEATLKPTGLVHNIRWPREIGVVRSPFPEMRVMTRWDRNRDAGYILRWETLPAHRDIPRDPPWPEPVMLEVFKAQSPQDF